jgi:hypothetical protein
MLHMPGAGSRVLPNDKATYELLPDEGQDVEGGVFQLGGGPEGPGNNVQQRHGIQRTHHSLPPKGFPPTTILHLLLWPHVAQV